MPDQMKTISIVTPCYNEELCIRDCYAAVRAIFDQELTDYAREHVFCDNASTDGTAAILLDIAAKDPAVKVIFNSRNFGPMRSNYNGVMAATGDAVLICMVADLQDPPELIPDFVRKWQDGYDVVYGIRATRDESVVWRAVRRAYYGLLSGLSDLSVPPGVGDFQLVDRRVVEAMRQIEDRYPFMRMMTFEVGAKSIGVPYHWRARARGISKNTLSRLVDQGMNGIVTFTVLPVRFLLLVGFVTAGLALLYAVISFVAGLIRYRELAEPGIMTIVTALFFFGGVQLLVTGIIGEYILAIHGQVRRKPVVFERGRVNFDAQSSKSP
jgi:polyisoprenyl-phosphate glycosyltransferase